MDGFLKVRETKESEEEFSFKKLFVPLTTFKAITIILLLGLAIYFLAFFNGFISDDYTQIVNNVNIHSIYNVPSLFAKGNNSFESGQTNNFYRPMLSVIYAIIYLFSGQNPFGYHFIQVLLHILDTILIWLIFRHFFKKVSALILSILFLIHPINTESVLYVATMGENLFLCFGLIALYLTISNTNKSKNYLIPFLLLLSLLSKETGIVFLFLIPFFNYLYGNKGLLKKIIQSISILFIYFFLRFAIANIYINNGIKIVPIQTLPLNQRLINVPQIIFYYLKTFFYPENISVFQSWIVKTLSLKDFYFPLFIDIVFLLLLTFIGIFIFKKHNNNFKTFIFFLIWFLIGLTSLIQIFPLDETVSDNWFYFPIIGILGMGGILVNNINLKRKISLWATITVFIVILISCSIIDIIRTTNWFNQATLFSHDVKFNAESNQIQGGLSDVAYAEGKFNLAENYSIKSTELFPSQITYLNLGTFYLRTNKPQKAIIAYNKALKYNSNSADVWGYLAIAYYNLGDKSYSLAAAKKAYTISPTNTYIVLLYYIEHGYRISIN